MCVNPSGVMDSIHDTHTKKRMVLDEICILHIAISIDGFFSKIIFTLFRMWKYSQYSYIHKHKMMILIHRTNKQNTHTLRSNLCCESIIGKKKCKKQQLRIKHTNRTWTYHPSTLISNERLTIFLPLCLCAVNLEPPLPMFFFLIRQK